MMSMNSSLLGLIENLRQLQRNKILGAVVEDPLQSNISPLHGNINQRPSRTIPVLLSIISRISVCKYEHSWNTAQTTNIIGI